MRLQVIKLGETLNFLEPFQHGQIALQQLNVFLFLLREVQGMLLLHGRFLDVCHVGCLRHGELSACTNLYETAQHPQVALLFLLPLIFVLELAGAFQLRVFADDSLQEVLGTRLGRY